MKTFQEAVNEVNEEHKLIESIELPKNGYWEIMPAISSVSKLNISSSKGDSGSVIGNIPTKIKFLKYINIPLISFDTVYGIFHIAFKFQAYDNTQLQTNTKIREAMTTLLEKTGLKIEYNRDANGWMYFKSKLSDKLDKKTFTMILKLFKTVLTEKNIDNALKPVLGDLLPIYDVVEKYIKTAKLKIEKTEEKGYNTKWTIKTKDPQTSYNELVKVILASGADYNSRNNLKITFPIQFNKYISVKIEDNSLTVETY